MNYRSKKQLMPGGILIGSSSEVHDLIPAQNALRMYQTVRRYGHYAIGASAS